MKRRNRKLRKALLMTCCALALVAISVGATLAYLTDTEGVTNVFTVGQVKITLDEADTDDSTPDEDRDQRNEYHLIPGQTYDKDPTVHVDAVSEDSWIFVKVENGLAAIEAEDTATTKTTIASQIEANGWTALKNVPGVYYKAYSKTHSDKDLEVFGSFTLKGAGLVNGDAADGEESIDDYANATIEVTAYAIQMAGFETDPAAAWQAGNWN